MRRKRPFPPIPTSLKELLQAVAGLPRILSRRFSPRPPGTFQALPSSRALLLSNLPCQQLPWVSARRRASRPKRRLPFANQDRSWFLPRLPCAHADPARLLPRRNLSPLLVNQSRWWLPSRLLLLPLLLPHRHLSSRPPVVIVALPCPRAGGHTLRAPFLPGACLPVATGAM